MSNVPTGTPYMYVCVRVYACASFGFCVPSRPVTCYDNMLIAIRLPYTTRANILVGTKQSGTRSGTGDGMMRALVTTDHPEQAGGSFRQQWRGANKYANNTKNKKRNKSNWAAGALDSMIMVDRPNCDAWSYCKGYHNIIQDVGQPMVYQKMFFFCR